MSVRETCQARVNRGADSCWNYAKDERFGLHVCNVHKKMIDRLAFAHGGEYALMIARHEWKRPEATMPRVLEVRP